jgi:hypothetical protein
VVQGPHPGEPVYGTSWRRHSERRQRAARIARMLRPAAHALGGLVSTELIVPYAGRWYRPDVGVVLDADPPIDGVLGVAPALVVCLGGPLRGADWLRAGAGAVWDCDDDVVALLTRRGVRRMSRGQWLTHPDEPALRLAADELTAGPLADARIGA